MPVAAVGQELVSLVLQVPELPELAVQQVQQVVVLPQLAMQGQWQPVVSVVVQLVLEVVLEVEVVVVVVVEVVVELYGHPVRQVVLVAPAVVLWISRVTRTLELW